MFFFLCGCLPFYFKFFYCIICVNCLIFFDLVQSRAAAGWSATPSLTSVGKHCVLPQQFAALFLQLFFIFSVKMAFCTKRCVTLLDSSDIGVWQCYFAFQPRHIWTDNEKICLISMPELFSATM